MQQKLKQVRRARRKVRVRKSVVGDAQRPRLTVYRSLKHMYAQVIDDQAGKTLVSASTAASKSASGGNIKAAGEVGRILAEQALAAGIKQVAFDRNGYRYHGRIKAVADAARKAGLEF